MKNNNPVFYCLALVVTISSSCTGTYKAKQLAEVISTDRTEVQLRPGATDQISFTYTGCSGFFIRYQDQVLIHDPFFSNEGPLATLAPKVILTDTAAVDQFFQTAFPGGTDNKGEAKLLLASHTHYDHIMDVPYIYEELLNKDSVQLLTTDDGIKVMQYYQSSEQRSLPPGLKSVEVPAGTQEQQLQTYYSYNGRIRVRPIMSSHAPHYYGLHLFKGHIEEQPQKVKQWKEGATLSFLVDFLSPEGEIVFRIYLNSAAATRQDGFVPVAYLEEHPVDVALICAASFTYVKDYPEALMQHLQPRHVIIAHWENFFQRREALLEAPMTVPFTNVKKFIRRLEKVAKQLPTQPSWTLPQLNTTITVRY